MTTNVSFIRIRDIIKTSLARHVLVLILVQKNEIETKYFYIALYIFIYCILISKLAIFY